MPENTAVPSRLDTSDLRRRSSRLVRHVRRDVLTTPGRRAAVRAALGREPGDPRTFTAIGEIASFLPDRVEPAVEHAFLAVAAMMCAQPAGPREQDVALRKAGAAVDGEEAKPDGDLEDVGGDSAEATRVRSLGASCAEAVRAGVSSGATMEKRLHALCRANSAGLHRQLPRLVSLLRAGRVRVDWVTLIENLAGWNRHSRRISATWLRDYYRGLSTDTAKQANDNPEQEHA